MTERVEYTAEVKKGNALDEWEWKKLNDLVDNLDKNKGDTEKFVTDLITSDWYSELVDEEKNKQDDSEKVKLRVKTEDELKMELIKDNMEYIKGIQWLETISADINDPIAYFFATWKIFNSKLEFQKFIIDNELKQPEDLRNKPDIKETDASLKEKYKKLLEIISKEENWLSFQMSLWTNIFDQRVQELSSYLNSINVNKISNDVEKQLASNESEATKKFLETWKTMNVNEYNSQRPLLKWAPHIRQADLDIEFNDLYNLFKTQRDMMITYLWSQDKYLDYLDKLEPYNKTEYLKGVEQAYIAFHPSPTSPILLAEKRATLEEDWVTLKLSSYKELQDDQVVRFYKDWDWYRPYLVEIKWNEVNKYPILIAKSSADAVNFAKENSRVWVNYRAEAMVVTWQIIQWIEWITKLVSWVSWIVWSVSDFENTASARQTQRESEQKTQSLQNLSAKITMLDSLISSYELLCASSYDQEWKEIKADKSSVVDILSSDKELAKLISAESIEIIKEWTDATAVFARLKATLIPIKWKYQAEIIQLWWQVNAPK